MKDVACVLLAGGLATRMGGGDKGLKEVGGIPIIQRVIDVVRPQVGPIVVNANGDGNRFSSLGFDVIADSVDGFVGPLAGILAGMDYHKKHDWMLSVPTDTPFLPDDLVKRLWQPIKDGKAEISIANSGGFDHPVIGIWPVKLKVDLRKALVEEDIRKLKMWIKRYAFTSIEWDIEPIDPFFNANSPDDLTRLNA